MGIAAGICGLLALLGWIRTYYSSKEDGLIKVGVLVYGPVAFVLTILCIVFSSLYLLGV